MKSVSLILRVVAILGAIAAVALWFNTKGKIKQATSDMSGLEGVTLLEKSAKVPALLEEKARIQGELKATKTRASELEARGKELAANLEAEQARNVRANQDLVKANTEARKAKIDIEDLKKQINENETKIANLMNELKDSKKMDNNAEMEAINQRLTALQLQHTALQKEYEIAKQKADLLDISEIVTVETVDAGAGTKTTVKSIYPPYVGSGDIATVTIVEGAQDLIALNRGKDGGLGPRQVIELRDNTSGTLIAQVTVVEVGDNFAIASVNPKIGRPETLEDGDMLELVKTVEINSAAPTATTPPAPTVQAAEVLESDGD